MSPRKSGKRRMKRSRRSEKLLLAIGLLAVVVVVVTVFYVFGMNSTSTPAEKVRLQTSMGDIIIQLRDDRPITTSNFKNLIEQGVYDGTILHRVIADFMIQGGDPTGTGYGDPLIPTIKDELDDVNENRRGTIAMANTGQPNTGSSQFFINVADNNYLDTKHSVFGTVISGMDVVNVISQVATDANDKPLTDVTLTKAEIIS